MQQVCSNAYQQYIRSRPGASVESVKRTKELRICEAGVIPEYRDVAPAAADLLTRMKNYRPQGVSKSCDELQWFFLVSQYLFYLFIMYWIFVRYRRLYSKSGQNHRRSIIKS